MCVKTFTTSCSESPQRAVSGFYTTTTVPSPRAGTLSQDTYDVCLSHECTYEWMDERMNEYYYKLSAVFLILS